MYTALLGCLTTPGLDGMRFALFLVKFSSQSNLQETPFYKLLYPTESDRLAGYAGWYC
jgi:hypothetical protein